MWDFDDPAASERRFRDARSTSSGRDQDVLSTQLARALGLQERWADAHAVLDALGLGDDDELAVRVALERGRLLRSAGDPAAAAPFFDDAVARAAAGGLDVLHVDALHMAALVAPVDEQVTIVDRALALARTSSDPGARAWAPSLLNNRGMTHADAGRWPEALHDFEQALAGRRDGGDAGAVRVARWMVAWALRNLGRTDEALAIQRDLKAELDAVGEADPYVDEELELLDPTRR